MDGEKRGGGEMRKVADTPHSWFVQNSLPQVKHVRREGHRRQLLVRLGSIFKFELEAQPIVT